jgi:hypothetical protein
VKLMVSTSTANIFRNVRPISHKKSYISLTEWVARAQIMLRGETYSFKRHEYLKQILEDRHPDQVFLKGAQVGISTVVLLKALYVADHLNKKAIYFFQDDGAVKDFSDDRANPIIISSPYLSSRTRGTSNSGLKHLGPYGSLFFRGLQNAGKAKSIDGDMIVLDEVSEMRDEYRALAQDRVMHSDLQWIHHLSQPDLPGKNIDAEFNTTDAHFWHLICPGCNHRNCLELNFPDNFIPIAETEKKKWPEGVTHYRGCTQCGHALNPKVGEWIPRHPTRSRRGYHLSQLYTQIKPPAAPNYATYIMKEYETSKLAEAKIKRFTISVLGFGYGGSNVRVTDELLTECEGSHGFSFSETGAFMGVDQGDILHIVIGVRIGKDFHIVYAEETESWSRLDVLMVQYGVSLCLIDALPNKHTAKSFVSRHRGRAAIQYFAGKELKRGVEIHEGFHEIDTVAMDRTEALDAMIDRMQLQKLILPSRRMCSGSDLATLEDVRRHLRALTTKNETGSNGMTRRVYDSGPMVMNHFGMAMNSAVVAAFELGVQPGPMVMPIFLKR